MTGRVGGSRRLGRLGAAWLVVVALLVPGAPRLAGATHARGEELLPGPEHTSVEARALAEAHRPDLAALLADLGRCEADLDVHRHGLGFRRPRGVDGAHPYLTAWVWLDPAQPVTGADLVGRAADAFSRHARRLFRRLLGRPAIEADPRLGGYAIVLTWFPRGHGDPPIGETLVVFADTAETRRFVRDGEPATRFLAAADVRYFDGQTPIQAPRPQPVDLATPIPPDGC